IDAGAIPAIEGDGVRVRVIAGEYRGAAGPAQTLMPTFLWHATLAPGATLESELPEGFEAGAYVIAGEARIAGALTSSGSLAVLSDEGKLRIENAGAA